MHGAHFLYYRPSLADGALTMRTLVECFRVLNIVSDRLHLMLLWPPPSRLSAPRKVSLTSRLSCLVGLANSRVCGDFVPLRKAARNNHKTLNSTNATLSMETHGDANLFQFLHFCIFLS